MATQIIKMPDTDGSGDVVEFCIQIGDAISEGDSILVLESDKASMEVPSDISGSLVEWMVSMGDTVETGTPLAVIEVAESVPAVAAEAPAISSESVSKPVAESAIAAPESVVIADESVVIEMPDAGGNGDLIEFYKQVGDSFSEGEALLLVESDKAAMEVPAPFDGTVESLLAAIGDSVGEGTPLIQALRTGTVAVAQAAPASVTAAPEKAPAIPEATKPKPAAPSVVRDTSPVVSSGPAYAGPATRKLARELGVDLSQVTGTGKRSRIIKDDVKQFVKSRMTNPVQTMAVGSGIPAIPAQDFSRFGEIDTVDLSGIAKATSAHMTRCWLNIPHVTLFDEVDVTDLEAFRKLINPDQHGLDKKPSILPFIVMFAARALRKYPQFNSSLHPNGEQIIYKDYVNIGVAVDTPAGLVVPVIKDADKKSISELTKDIQILATKARDRKLKPEDMQGGCFTVSSLGASGGTGFTPIINGPEVAILGVAKSAIKPVWDGAEFQPRQQLPLCLSFDHRVINGADAGRFMAMLNQCLSHMGNALL